MNLAKIADFSAALILGDEEKAGQMGDEFGTALGQTIAGGVKLFAAADQYLFNIGYTGDYGKPFTDVVELGNALNQRWDAMPPREQERLKLKLLTEAGADALIGAGSFHAIGNAKKFTEILDDVAAQAARLGERSLAGSKKTARAISETIDELMQPPAVTPDGQRIRIPRNRDNPDTLLMSKTDDLDNSDIPKRDRPTDRPENRDSKRRPSDRLPDESGQKPEDHRLQDCHLFESFLINKRKSPDLVVQHHPNACVSACGEMLTDGKLNQNALHDELMENFLPQMRKPNSTVDIKGLSRNNTNMASGYVDEGLFS